MTKEKSPKETKFTIDGDSYTTTEKILTVREIMGMAGVDPDSSYLVELKGDEQVSYQGKPDGQIHIHNKSEFLTRYVGETPVS